jgi:hypothetical protein
MSAEAERVFSGARRTISWERTRLSSYTVERTECVKSWMKNKLIYSGFMALATPQAIDKAIEQFKGGFETSDDIAGAMEGAEVPSTLNSG